MRHLTPPATPPMPHDRVVTTSGSAPDATATRPGPRRRG